MQRRGAGLSKFILKTYEKPYHQPNISKADRRVDTAYRVSCCSPKPRSRHTLMAHCTSTTRHRGTCYRATVAAAMATAAVLAFISASSSSSVGVHGFAFNSRVSSPRRTHSTVKTAGAVTGISREIAGKRGRQAGLVMGRYNWAGAGGSSQRRGASTLR